MNPDKTSLEREIEKRELARFPAFLYVIIFILLIFSAALGAYAFKLHNEINAQDNNVSTIKKSFSNEITSLRQRIEQLQNENVELKKMIQEHTPPSQKKIKKKSYLHQDIINTAQRELSL